MKTFVKLTHSHSAIIRTRAVNLLVWFTGLQPSEEDDLILLSSEAYCNAEGCELAIDAGVIERIVHMLVSEPEKEIRWNCILLTLQLTLDKHNYLEQTYAPLIEPVVKTLISEDQQFQVDDCCKILRNLHNKGIDVTEKISTPHFVQKLVAQMETVYKHVLPNQAAMPLMSIIAKGTPK